MVRAQANTRMRDFYDIYALLKENKELIDRDILKEAFFSTCKRRKSMEQIANIDDVMKKIADDEIMKQQWNNYQKNNYYVGTLEWNDVIKSVKKIIDMINLQI